MFKTGSPIAGASCIPALELPIKPLGLFKIERKYSNLKDLLMKMFFNFKLLNLFISLIINSEPKSLFG